MTQVAIKFIEELKQGQISEAIDTIKSSLSDATIKMIEESRNELLQSYGFSLVEKKDMDDDDDDSDEDDDSSDSDEKDSKKDSEDDKKVKDKDSDEDEE